MDECKQWDSTPTCGSNATCYNTYGSFYCQCQHGFRSTTSLKFTPFAGECKDLNECLENPPVCGSNTICLNTIGSYNCQCQPGFRVPTYAEHCAGESKKRASMCVCVHVCGGVCVCVCVCVCPLQMRMSVCGFPWCAAVWACAQTHLANTPAPVRQGSVTTATTLPPAQVRWPRPC
ncbi:unnamed protein product [Oncorhynchus mykiss]|uniref:EGF-like domain-containing protein n=1 Tax=Oncorhynchus mykiss TaxID=8022 RepID=A0A060Z387_ONCMY|nr:unnamed protein product [Oncorhynchus mykiss]